MHLVNIARQKQSDNGRLIWNRI